VVGGGLNHVIVARGNGREGAGARERARGNGREGTRRVGLAHKKGSIE